MIVSDKPLKNSRKSVLQKRNFLLTFSGGRAIIQKNESLSRYREIGKMKDIVGAWAKVNAVFLCELQALPEKQGFFLSG